MRVRPTVSVSEGRGAAGPRRFFLSLRLAGEEGSTGCPSSRRLRSDLVPRKSTTYCIVCSRHLIEWVYCICISGILVVPRWCSYLSLSLSRSIGSRLAWVNGAEVAHGGCIASHRCAWYLVTGKSRMQAVSFPFGYGLRFFVSSFLPSSDANNGETDMPLGVFSRAGSPSCHFL